ncbi:MAG: hypothetical protein JWR15_806 [Prosthecobacter sp.]|nr:hypothetical protein [Prosthecobacter sp.]
MEMNPYAAPQSQVLQVTSEDEVIRKLHINTEATIKSVGTLYYLGAFFLIVYGLILLGVGLSAMKQGSWLAALIGFVVLALGIGQGRLAYGLSKLSSWARTPTIILSSLGLLAIPLGTLINIYILVKITGQKGQFVFTPEYQRIMAATPHVKRKTSMVVWVILLLLLLILVGSIVFNMNRN